MNNLTKMKVYKPANEVFEAFVDPEKIKNFWFSWSSGRWETGKKIRLRYDEYNAELELRMLEVELNKKIVFTWGSNGEGHVVTLIFNEKDSSTVVEVNEEGFDEGEEDFLIQIVDNKEGWVYMLTCLKAYSEFGIKNLRAALVK